MSPFAPGTLIFFRFFSFIFIPSHSPLSLFRFLSVPLTISLVQERSSLLFHPTPSHSEPPPTLCGTHDASTGACSNQSERTTFARSHRHTRTHRTGRSSAAYGSPSSWSSSSRSRCRDTWIVFDARVISCCSRSVSPLFLSLPSWFFCARALVLRGWDRFADDGLRWAEAAYLVVVVITA